MFSAQSGLQSNIIAFMWNKRLQISYNFTFVKLFIFFTDMPRKPWERTNTMNGSKSPVIGRWSFACHCFDELNQCVHYTSHFIMPFEEDVQLLGSKSSAGPVFLKANLNYCCFDWFASHACGREPLTIACQNAGSRVPCLTSLKHSAVASHQLSVYQSRSAFFEGLAYSFCLVYAILSGICIYSSTNGWSTFQ